MILIQKIKIFPLMLSLALPVFAQHPGPGIGLEEMEARREKIEALRIYKMTQFLDLSQEQAMVFYPRLNAYEQSIRQKQKRQMDLIREIDRKIRETNYKPNDADVKKYNRQIVDTEREIIQEKEKFIDELGTVLTPEQQLRYIIFESRFRERLIHALSKPK